MTLQLIHQDIEPRIDGVAITTGASIPWQFSGWKIEGIPGHEVAPGAIAIPTNTTGLRQANPGAGKELWLASWHAVSQAQTISLNLSDRLLHVGGLDATLATLQEFAAGATTNVDRDPTPTGDGLGVGNELWIEISTLIGNTIRTLTINYTDADDAAQSVTHQLGGSGHREAGILLAVPLANDRGVKGLVSCQLDASTGTAGDFAIVVGHRLATLHVGISTAFAWRALDRGFVKIPDNACLWTHWAQHGAITAANIFVQALYALVDY